MNDDFTIIVVDDEQCPGCGGNGSPKVTDADGVCHWKCLSQECPGNVAYWVPGRGEDWIEYRLSPEEQAESNARIKAQVDAMFAERGPMVRLDDGSRPGIESWGWK